MVNYLSSGNNSLGSTAEKWDLLKSLNSPVIRHWELHTFYIMLMINTQFLVMSFSSEMN